jgi:Uma2 family endonuclease
MNAVLKLPIFEEELPKGFELVRGRLVEKSMGAEAGEVGIMLGSQLLNHVRANRLGTVYNSEGAYRCFPPPLKTVRKPDVSFVRRERLPNGRSPAGDLRIVPDLAAEVVSLHDAARDLEEKIDDYLSVRVPLLWVIHPNTRTAYVYRSNGSVTRLTERDHLDGEEVIPGFRCLLAEVLPELPEEAPPEPEAAPPNP